MDKSREQYKVLLASTGDPVVSTWVVEASEFLGVPVFIGKYLYFDSRSLVCPPDEWGSWGLLALCGLALFRRKEAPFLAYQLVAPPGIMDPLLYQSIRSAEPTMNSKSYVLERCRLMRRHVMYSLGLGPDSSKSGLGFYAYCSERGRLPALPS